MPDVESVRSGYLAVEDGNQLYFEAAGNQRGPAVLWLHGGPGSGTGTAHRGRVDLARQRSVSFDQRGCGRSHPLVTDCLDRLETNTTEAQIADIEALRRHLEIDRWLVTGASWGATLGLAYAQAHPERVTGIALVAVTNTSTEEVEWITQAMGRIFPEEWDRFAAARAPVRGADRRRVRPRPARGRCPRPCVGGGSLGPLGGRACLAGPRLGTRSAVAEPRGARGCGDAGDALLVALRFWR
jgi:proline iminopeptidase